MPKKSSTKNRQFSNKILKNNNIIAFLVVIVLVIFILLLLSNIKNIRNINPKAAENKSPNNKVSTQALKGKADEFESSSNTLYFPLKFKIKKNNGKACVRYIFFVSKPVIGNPIVSSTMILKSIKPDSNGEFNFTEKDLIKSITRSETVTASLNTFPCGSDTGRLYSHEYKFGNSYYTDYDLAWCATDAVNTGTSARKIDLLDTNYIGKHLNAKLIKYAPGNPVPSLKGAEIIDILDLIWASNADHYNKKLPDEVICPPRPVNGQG